MKTYLRHQRGRTGDQHCLDYCERPLYTGTSVLLTFTTNAIFSRDMKALLLWSTINLSVWELFD